MKRFRLEQRVFLNNDILEGNQLYCLSTVNFSMVYFLMINLNCTISNYMGQFSDIMCSPTTIKLRSYNDILEGNLTSCTVFQRLTFQWFTF